MREAVTILYLWINIKWAVRVLIQNKHQAIPITPCKHFSFLELYPFSVIHIAPWRFCWKLQFHNIVCFKPCFENFFKKYINDIFLIFCPSIFWHQIEFLMLGIFFSMKNIKCKGVPLVLHSSVVTCAREWLWTRYSCAHCWTAHFSAYISSARHWKTWPRTASNLQHLSSSVLICPFIPSGWWGPMLPMP